MAPGISLRVSKGVDMKPENEPSLDRVRDPPEVRRRKGMLGRGFVVGVGIYVLGAVSLYIAIVVYGLLSSS